MTQSILTSGTNNFESEPRRIRENLPNDVRHRVELIEAALSNVEQVTIVEEAPILPDLYKTPVPFDMESALQQAEAIAAQAKPQYGAMPTVTAQEQPPVVPQSLSNPEIEDLRRQVWGAYEAN